MEAVGAEVTRFKVGDRVASAGSGSPGAYADYSVSLADRTVALPAGVDFHTAAAALLKGMTVEFLLRRLHRVEAGETILVHAAAGGVGQILVQWAKVLGAVVIATVGSEAKAARVRELGADHVILYRTEDVAAEVRRITDGQGVPVAYDSVGKDTFEGTLKSLARRGLFVSFGNASGPPPAVEARQLTINGSLFFTRPTMADYQATTEELRRQRPRRLGHDDRFRQGEDRDRPDLRPGRCPQGAWNCFGEPRHHRLKPSDSLTAKAPPSSAWRAPCFT